MGEIDSDGDGFSPCDGDCNDDDGTIFPGAPEECNGVDDNCDNVIPDDEDDLDRDNYRVCEGDCDDADSFTFPGAGERNDGKDNDCDGEIPAIEEATGNGGTGAGVDVGNLDGDNGATSADTADDANDQVLVAALIGVLVATLVICGVCVVYFGRRSRKEEDELKAQQIKLARLEASRNNNNNSTKGASANMRVLEEGSGSSSAFDSYVSGTSGTSGTSAA